MNNPAAFPSQLREASAPGDHDPEVGMTLRDYFAAQIISGMVSNANGIANIAEGAKKRGQQSSEVVALTAYAFADAMLSVREKSA